jgi:hypothetical protein
LAAVGDPDSSEVNADAAEDFAGALVKVHLPEERQRICDLLQVFPGGHETKIQKLLAALGTLWRRNPREKVVIFATYLGTVDLIAVEIEAAYPGQGIVVLRGGDHGAKLAAERRFRRPDGPCVPPYPPAVPGALRADRSQIFEGAYLFPLYRFAMIRDTSHQTTSGQLYGAW